MNNELENLSDFAILKSENPCKVFIRLKTSYYRTSRGLSIRRDLNFLKRKCIGFNFVDEDVGMIGADETIQRIINLSGAKDGIYQVITCNESRDWETGYLDDYDFKLIPI